MTQQEVADKHDCSRMTVSRRMREYGLEHLPRLSVQERDSGRRYYSSGGERFAEYQLVAIADGADPYAVFEHAQVHHINGCRHDNRPENLVALTPQEHGMVEHGDFEVDYDSGEIYKPLDLL
jgi:hypothetical protein